MPDFSYNEKLTKELECYNGWTDVGIFIYFEELILEDCQECNPPMSEDENIIAYYFELPCEPICGPNAPTGAPVIDTARTFPAQPQTDCYDQINMNVVDKLPNDSSIGSEIISITELNSDSIAFEVVVRDDYEMISVGYDDAGNHHRQCYEDFNVLGGEKIPIIAGCYDNVASLTVIMYVGENFERASCQACSLPSGDIEDFVAITLEVPCDPITCEPTSAPSPSSRKISSVVRDEVDCYDDMKNGVLCGGTRRLEGSNQNISASSLIDHSKASKMNPGTVGSIEEAAPFCSHKDFPCEGDVESMVHVCYYSSNAGYHTFCIPEADSDIVQNNENHYCGPCQGWTGGDQGLQII